MPLTLETLYARGIVGPYRCKSCRRIYSITLKSTNVSFHADRASYYAYICSKHPGASYLFFNDFLASGKPSGLLEDFLDYWERPYLSFLMDESITGHEFDTYDEFARYVETVVHRNV